MQNMSEKSHISSEESKSELNSERNEERNAIRSSKCYPLTQQNTCDTNHCNGSEFVNESRIRTEFDESIVEVKEDNEVILHFFDDENDSEMKSKTKYIRNNRTDSPIEELRSDRKEWQDFHTSTSTPTSKKNVFPDLNISIISSEESDSDFLHERQISRFQITDEFVNSSLNYSIFDDNEDKQ